MDVKKHVSFILLSLAVSFLLMHAVLPHCHHKEIVHIMALSDFDFCCEHEKATTESDSGTHEHTSLDNCVLKTIVARDNSTHDNYTCICHTCNLLLFTYVLDIWEMEFVDVNSFSLPKPYIESCYTSYISPTQGLRAPPFVA